MDLSLIIPCFNESEGVSQMRKQMEAAKPLFDQRGTWELLFIDDGSTDDTFERLSSTFSDWKNVRVVRHGHNQGLAAGLRTGFAHATGDIVVVTDSDGTYPFTTIPELLDCMTPDVDIVTSSAYHPRGGVDGVPAYRLLFSQSASLIYRLIVDWRVHTYTAMYRAYRRKVIEQLPITTEGYLVMAQLLVDGLLAGYRVAEYPTVLRVRRYGQSKAKVWKITRQHLRFQVGVIWRRITESRRRFGRA